MTNVARAIRKFRETRSWSAAYLANRCALLGMPSLDRSAITNIETGRRKRIGVDELLVLAAALSVAPTHLLVPLTDEPYAIVPTRTTNAGRAREWVRGNYPLRFPTLPMEPSRNPAAAGGEGHDVEMYLVVRPVKEWQPPEAKPQVDRGAVLDAIEDGSLTATQSTAGGWVFAAPHDPTEDRADG